VSLWVPLVDMVGEDGVAKWRNYPSKKGEFSNLQCEEGWRCSRFPPKNALAHPILYVQREEHENRIPRVRHTPSEHHRALLAR
jgi:hypothetical protein